MVREDEGAAQREGVSAEGAGEASGGESVLFEARLNEAQLAQQRAAAAPALWFPLMIALHAESWIVSLVIATLSACAIALLLFGRPSKKRALLLQITDRTLRGQFGGSGWVRAANFRAAFRMTLGLQLEEIFADEVRGIAWETGGRLGIQLADGNVAPVSYEFGIPPADLDGARSAVCAFVQRATGSSWPPREEPLDVAPWVMRKPQRPTA